jgi:1,4-dihydroxy-2-naphthoate octaprenyltransferase
VGIALPTFTFDLVVVLPVSASIHHADEYADYETDSLTRRTPFSGGSGALPESGLTPGIALKAAWFALLVGVVLGLLGMYLGLLSPTALAVFV